MKEMNDLKYYVKKVKVFNRGSKLTLAVFEALDGRLSDKDDGIERHIADLWEEHGSDAQRITALEANMDKVFCHAGEWESRVNDRLTALEANSTADQAASLAAQAMIHDRLTALETTRTDLARGLTNVEMRMDLVECGQKRKPTLPCCEECAEWPYGKASPTPLSCCEGCADFPCDHEPRGFIPQGKEKPVECYREKDEPKPNPYSCCTGCAKWPCDNQGARDYWSKVNAPGGKPSYCPCFVEKGFSTCRDCRKVRLSIHYRGLGSCPEVPVLHRDDDACPNFKAVK